MVEAVTYTSSDMLEPGLHLLVVPNLSEIQIRPQIPEPPEAQTNIQFWLECAQKYVAEHSGAAAALGILGGIAAAHLWRAYRE